MRNLRMKEKMERGDAIDVGDLAIGRTPEGDYVLRGFIDAVDYCVAGTEEWIWSIGRRRSDGAIVASTSARLYENPEFECLWLR